MAPKLDGRKVSLQELAKLADRIFSYVIRVLGAVGQTVSGTQKAAVRRRAEESTRRLENSLGFAHERVIRLDVLDRLETGKKIVFSRGERETRHVGTNERKIVRDTSGFVKSSRRQVERGHMPGARMQQKTRAVAAAAGRVQNMGAFREARRPSITHDVLMPEPRRGPAVERETFH